MVISSAPMSLTTCFITSSGQGLPAMIPVRRLDVSYFSYSGCSSSAMNIVGTPKSAVHRSSWTACNTFSASNCSTGTIVPSWVTVFSVPKTHPKQWKNGTGMQTRSSDPSSMHSPM
jgi:hypothetical protein